MNEWKQYSVQGQQIARIRDKVASDNKLCELLSRLIETHEAALMNEGASSLAAQFMYREAVNIAKQSNLTFCSGCNEWVEADNACSYCGRFLANGGLFLADAEELNQNHPPL